MSDICTTCGLPKDLCVCETIAKESQKITAKIVKKKFGKKYTIIQGINENEIDLKDLAKKLKTKFACGGTAKDGIVELQGDHLKRIREELVSLGFAPETIEIKQR
ncbi:stress response translation initiation inhibitor YciH [Candidatus Woesearchaeota archaeon]|nr:stress response translation initiation inhibitor YciH [Candidatus Woesearchaeota archaeon]